MSAQEKDRVKSFPSDVGAILKRVCKGGRSSCLGKGQKGPKRKYQRSKYLSKCQTKCFLAQRRTAGPCITVQKSIFSKESGKLLQRFIGICAKNMKMWYVRLVFVFIFYINSNEHENQYLLWHGHLLLSSLA